MTDEIHRRIYFSPNVTFAVLLVAFLGFNSLALPRLAAQMCGSSSYWVIPIAFLFALPFIFLAVCFQRRFGTRNLLTAAPLVLGRPAAIAGNLIFLSSFFTWLILSIRNAMDLILTYLLSMTPYWVVLAAFLLLVGYLAMNGLAAVGRMASFIIFFAVSFRLAMQILAMQNLTRLNLLPVFSAAPLDYLKGSTLVVSDLLPVLTIFLIYPLLSKGEKLLPISLLSTGGAVFIFLLEILGTIGVFGRDYTLYFSWPNLALIHRIDLPYLVLEQVGLLFLIVWLTMFFVASAFYCSLIAGGLKEQFPSLNYRWTVWALLAGIFAVCLAIHNAIIADDLYYSLRGWLPVPAAGYVLLIYITAVLKGAKNSHAV